MMEEPSAEKFNPPVDGPSPLKQIRTFQGDVAAALQRQRESLVSIQQREASKRGFAHEITNSATLDSQSKRIKIFSFLLGSLALIGVSLVGAWYTYQEFVKKTAPPTLSVPTNRLFSTESEITIDGSSLSRELLLRNINDATLDIEPNELRHILLRDGTGEISPILTTNGFLETIESQAPSSLVRAFEPIFMLGTLGESRFIIIPLASFENAFAGMLAWETNLAEDLGPIFGKAELLKSIGSESVFKDIVSRNKDARVLTVEEETVILYSFFDNEKLIITEDIETLRVLIDRLTREKLSR